MISTLIKFKKVNEIEGKAFIFLFWKNSKNSSNRYCDLKFLWDLYFLWNLYLFVKNLLKKENADMPKTHINWNCLLFCSHHWMYNRIFHWTDWFYYLYFSWICHVLLKTLDGNLFNNKADFLKPFSVLFFVLQFRSFFMNTVTSI